LSRVTTSFINPRLKDCNMREVLQTDNTGRKNVTSITDGGCIFLYDKESFHSFHMDPEKKEIMRDWGMETLIFLKKIAYIENDYTGKLEIEFNITQGGLGDLKIKRETRIFK
jgi:hypothetical protein